MTTYLQLQDDVLAYLWDTTTATRALAKRALNRAQSDMWYRFPWKERRDQGRVTTSEPYSTGTATFTNGSAAVTGSGTTWTSAHTGMKIALTYGGPWYIFTRTGATTGTLDRNFVEATATDSTYVLYQDLFSLASDAESLLDEQVFIATNASGVLQRVNRASAERAWIHPAGAGRPSWFTLMGRDSSGYLTVRVGPLVPDSAYTIRYGYLKTVTDMSADGDNAVVPERFRHILIDGALRECFRLHQEHDLAFKYEELFEQKTLAAWVRQQSEVPQVMLVGGFDTNQGDGFDRFVNIEV